MSYLDGMGFGTTGGTVNAYGAAPAGVQANFGVTTGVRGGGGAQSGAIALLVLLGGLVVLYLSTRGIQGTLKG